MHRDWWVPLTGVAFVVVLIVSFVIGGEPPDVDEGAQKVVEHYVDNKDAVRAGALVSAIAASLLVFFAACLRQALRRPDPDSILPTAAFAGAILIAVGAAIDATISFAIAEAADDVDPVAVHSLQALWDNDFVPFVLGAQLLLLGSGLSIVRHGTLPKWLGWVGIVIGVLALTPLGFVAFLGGGIWVLVASVLLALRNRAAPPAATPDAPTQPVGVTR